MNPLNHPGRESRIVNISKTAIPATPSRLRREETYVFANPIIKVVIKIFPELPVIGQGVGFY